MQFSATTIYTGVGTIAGALVFGYLADIIGRKKCLIINALLVTTAMFITGLVADYNQFCAMRFITGIGIGAIWPIAVALMSEYSPASSRNTVVTYTGFGSQLGQIFVSLVGAKILASMGFRPIFFIGATSIVLIPFLIYLLPESVKVLINTGKISILQKYLVKSNPGYKPQDDDVLDLHEVAVGKAPFKHLFTEHRAISSVIFMLLFFFNASLQVVGSSWLPLFMTRAGFPLDVSVLSVSIVAFGSLFSTFFFGWMAQKISIKKILSLVYILGVIGLIGIGLAPGITLIYLSIFFFGMSTSGAINLLNTFTVRYYPPQVGATAVGTFQAVGRITLIISPVLVALIIGLNLSFQYNFLFFAGVAALTGILVSLVPLKYAHYKISGGN